MGRKNHRMLPLPDTVRDTLTAVYAYLDRHRGHIDYGAYKELGLPIGSGMVESACRIGED